MELRLIRHGRTEPEGRITWEPETGRLGGDLAAVVARLIDLAVADGGVTGDPWPTPYAVTDPRRSRRDMALVLGQYWRVPEALAGDYPQPPEADDTDLPLLR
jgi:hypothetical protein